MKFVSSRASFFFVHDAYHIAYFLFNVLDAECEMPKDHGSELLRKGDTPLAGS